MVQHYLKSTGEKHDVKRIAVKLGLERLLEEQPLRCVGRASG